MKENIENRIVLLVDRRQAIAIKDGATPDGRAFKPYNEGDDTEGFVAITLELPVWQRLELSRHTQSDIAAIAGQLELQLGA